METDLWSLGRFADSTADGQERCYQRPRRNTETLAGQTNGEGGGEVYWVRVPESQTESDVVSVE